MWLGGLVALVLSLPVGLICFRLQGPYFTIATIGLAEALRLLVLHFREITNGAQGLTVPYKGNAPWLLQFDSKMPYYYIALAMAIGVLLITRRMERSRLGHYLVAIGQNQDAAEALGIDSARAKRQALMLSAFLTGMGGVFYAQYTYVIHPDGAFGLGLEYPDCHGGHRRGGGHDPGSRNRGGDHRALRPVYPDHLRRTVSGAGATGVRRTPGGSDPLAAAGSLPLVRASLSAGWWPGCRGPEGVGREQARVLLDVEGLSKHFGGVQAVLDLSFQVREGEILGVIGPNGSGKTTTFHLITGFHRPDRGRVRFDGRGHHGTITPRGLRPGACAAPSRWPSRFPRSPSSEMS